MLKLPLYMVRCPKCVNISKFLILILFVIDVLLRRKVQSVKSFLNSFNFDKNIELYTKGNTSHQCIQYIGMYRIKFLCQSISQRMYFLLKKAVISRISILGSMSSWLIHQEEPRAFF